MGQLRARACPICEGPNDGRWTCQPCTVLVNTYRELLRNLQAWSSTHEALDAPDVLVNPADGRSYSLWDVETLYRARTTLPQQQQDAIRYCLFENLRESDAAVRLGVSPNCPVSIYATVGLTRLLATAASGSMPGFRLLLADGGEG